ncbi:hypothetical protein D9758_016864 [Tetrapyrgos nigripes]|uniref:Uncharacterized protein n=1 Tax=Tetrapyrgos nigripes TaxID=182062 RepID=A0A8H5CEA8_9AGAR|nr:hypothetical protein D9758_016864 [Tetrapyrgos nigripes]
MAFGCIEPIDCMGLLSFRGAISAVVEFMTVIFDGLARVDWEKELEMAFGCMEPVDCISLLSFRGAISAIVEFTTVNLDGTLSSFRLPRDSETGAEPLSRSPVPSYGPARAHTQ